MGLRTDLGSSGGLETFLIDVVSVTTERMDILHLFILVLLRLDLSFINKFVDLPLDLQEPLQLHDNNLGGHLVIIRFHFLDVQESES